MSFLISVQKQLPIIVLGRFLIERKIILKTMIVGRQCYDLISKVVLAFKKYVPSETTFPRKNHGKIQLNLCS